MLRHPTPLLRAPGLRRCVVLSPSLPPSLSLSLTHTHTWYTIASFHQSEGTLVSRGEGETTTPSASAAATIVAVRLVSELFPCPKLFDAFGGRRGKRRRVIVATVAGAAAPAMMEAAAVAMFICCVRV